MYNEVIAAQIEQGKKPMPFDLNQWILEQKYKEACANTDNVIRDIFK